MGKSYEELLKEVNRLEKVNKALMGRVERSTTHEGSAFSLFESNIVLSDTVRERTEELRQALEFNEAIKRSARFAIITTSLDGIINSFNPEAERILGYQSEEMVGKQSPAIFHDPQEVVEAAKSLSEELNTEVPVGFDTFIFKARLGQYDERLWTYICKNGSKVPVRLLVTGLYNSKGELSGYMGIARDISAQVELQKQLELERAKSIHNSKLASLGEMSAGIAHEINNPLAIITGCIPLLKKFKNNEEKFAAKLVTIEKAAMRIEKIVRGLRKFSRSSDGTVYAEESLSTIISEALTLTEAKSKLNFTPITVPAPNDIKIFCDGVEIEQVLVNLINNAIDAVKNLKEKWVKVETFLDSNQVVIRVLDSGPGIPQAIEEKLFQPFFTTKPVGEGTGLGLSIAKGILDQHKATITINRSFPNTCFDIRFTKATVHKKTA